MSSTPSVSVIIPSYRQANYLAEAVASVVTQTYKHWECVIVNDGSPDDTDAVAEALIKENPGTEIRLVKKPNGGLSDARNAGMRQSSGDLALFLDADDRLDARFLELTVAAIQSDPKAGFVYTAVQNFGASNSVWSRGEFCPERFLRKNQMTCSSLFRRRLFDQVGGLKQTMDRGFEDWEFWISLFELGWQGRLVNVPLFHYRKHHGESMLQRIQRQPGLFSRLFSQMVLLHPELYTDEELFIANQECNAEQREQLAKLRQSPRGSWSRASAENYRAAIVSLTRMLDSGPATAEKWAMLASVAFKLGDIASGLKALETAECINPDLPLTRRVREQYPSMAGTTTGGLALAPLRCGKRGEVGSLQKAIDY